MHTQGRYERRIAATCSSLFRSRRHGAKRTDEAGPVMNPAGVMSLTPRLGKVPLVGRALRSFDPLPVPEPCRVGRQKTVATV